MYVPNVVWILLFFFAPLMAATTVSARSKQLSRLLFDALADDTRVDLAMAKKLLSQFKPEDSLHGDLSDGVPVLHRLFDLHRLANNPHQKAELVDIMLQCLKVGADPSKSSKNDPPLLFKAIILKELHLAKSFADSSAGGVLSMLLGPRQWSSLFLSHLYAIPSETIPLVKLLLHADTIVRSKGQAAVGGVDGIKKLLAGAVLGKPTVRAADLNLHSPQFSAMVGNLGLSDETGLSPGGGRIRLLDLIRSLDEVAGAVHQSVLRAALSDNGTALTLIQTITGSSSELRQDSPWPMGRNALHFLALAGGSLMVDQLREFLAQLHSIEAAEKERSAGASIGANGESSASEVTTVADDCALMMRRALASTDDRGHSPISYAVMRFSGNSPIAEALKALCVLVKLDFAAVVASAIAAGVLAAPANINGTSQAVEAPLADGGWSTKKASPAVGGDGSTEMKLLEVTGLTELPSNREFFEQYLNRGTPVVFRRPGFGSDGSVLDGRTSTGTGDSTRELRDVFRKDRFVAEYGAITVPAATIPYAGTFGVKQVLTTMKEVARSANSTGASSDQDVPLYTFCTPSAPWAPKLLAEAPVPRCIRRSSAGGDDEALDQEPEDSGVGVVDAEHASWPFEIQFYLGSAGTGAPAHFHGHAVNSLAYGEKAWLLYPPVHAFYSTTPAQQLFNVAASSGKGVVGEVEPLRVTQRAGDVLFVPALWGHATLNTQQSIGVAHEFSVESFCME